MFYEAFQCGDVSKSSIYAKTNSEQLSVIFSNFVVSYLCKLFNLVLNNARKVGELVICRISSLNFYCSEYIMSHCFTCVHTHTHTQTQTYKHIHTPFFLSLFIREKDQARITQMNKKLERKMSILSYTQAGYKYMLACTQCIHVYIHPFILHPSMHTYIQIAHKHAAGWSGCAV